MKKKILVFGIGNLVQSDDGFGVHAIRELQKETLPENVELLDAGTSIVDQLSDLVRAEKLICIDVAEGGSPPGTIYRFKPDDIVYRKSKFHHAHKTSIFDALEMVRHMRKKAPDTTIFAIQPENIDWGTELSPRIQKKMPKMIQLVNKEILNINQNQSDGKKYDKQPEE